MSAGSKNAKRATLFLLSTFVAACALTEPAVAQSSADSMRAFMARRLLHWRAPSPTYIGALAAAHAAQLQVIPVPMDERGVRPATAGARS